MKRKERKERKEKKWVRKEEGSVVKGKKKQGRENKARELNGEKDVEGNIKPLPKPRLLYRYKRKKKKEKKEKEN